MRIIGLLALATLVFSAVAANAEQTPKMKMKGMPEAECKMGTAQTNAACTMEQKKEQMKTMEKQQLKKADEMKKEAGKGSEKGQAMREEHSKKWWKFWGDKTEE
jgi:hypothetical protein